jgi:hypothetical protein
VLRQYDEISSSLSFQPIIRVRTEEEEEEYKRTQEEECQRAEAAEEDERNKGTTEAEVKYYEREADEGRGEEMESRAEAEAETGRKGGRPEEAEVNPTDKSEVTEAKWQPVKPTETVPGATSMSRETSTKREKESRRETTEERERERETRQQENGDVIGPGGADGEMFTPLFEPRIESLKAEGETEEDKSAR